MRKKTRRAVPLRKELFRELTDRGTGHRLGIWTYGGREYPVPAGMPSNLVILGKHYDVRYHTHIYMQRRRSEQLLGCVLLHRQVIWVDASRGLHEMRQTLCHEICHVYVQHSPLKLPHQVEELVCDVLGSGMYDLAQNNVRLF